MASRLPGNATSLPGRVATRFKIAYRPDYARFSPGVLMEVETIRYLHETHPVAWMDSCAAPDHPLINPLWPDRRCIESIYFSTGRWGGNLAVATLPLLAWLKRKIQRHNNN